MPTPLLSGPKDTFSTDFAATCAILRGLLSYLETPSEDAAEAARELVRRRGGTQVGKAFWSNALQSVIDADAAREDQDAPLEVHTGVDEFDTVLQTQSLDDLEQDDVRLGLFTKNGKARLRRIEPSPSAAPSSRASTRAQSEASVVDVPAALAAELSPARGDPGFDQDEPLHFAQAPQSEHRATVRGATSSGQPSLGRATAGRSALRRPTAESFFPANGPLANTSSGPSEHAGDESVDEDLDAAALQHLTALPHRADCTLPKDVVRTLELAVRYSANAVRDLVRAQARASRASGIPSDVCEAIIRNEYVDLGKVHAHDPSLEHSSLVASDLPDVFVQGPSPSTEIVDAHAWLVAFDKVRLYTMRFYPHRANELQAYRDWFSGRVARDPGRFRTYRDYDAHYRQHLGEPGFGHTLEDATRDAAAIATFFAAPPPSESRISTSLRRSRPDDDIGSSSSKRIKTPWPRDVCRKFNFGAEHDEEECKTFNPPRRHICRDCGMRGHRLGDAACAASSGGGTERRGRTDGAPPRSLRQ
ncbi:hypothetical protein JCM1841_004922 [Sporobolomyces salmonicolor]